MITDFTPEQWEKLQTVRGWEEYYSEKPVPIKISTGHYWNCFTIRSHLRNEIEEFTFSDAQRIIFQKSAVALDASKTDEEFEIWREWNQKEMARSFAMPHDYGVCDTPEQVLEQWPELVTDERKFLIVFSEIHKSEQPERGGWRWHKWGEYIGTKEPQWEYLADEDDSFETVLIFHVLRLKETDETV